MRISSQQPWTVVTPILILSILGLCPSSSAQLHGTSDVTDLMRAAAASDVMKVKELLKSGADPNARDNVGATALMWNVSWPEIDVTTNRQDFDEDIVDLLVEAGGKIDAQDAMGQTALIRAEGFGHSRMALKLVRKGANIHVKDKKGRSALTYAAWRDPDDYNVRHYLRSHVTVSLIDAILLKDVAKAQELVGSANLRDRGPMGETPLILACELGDLKVVETLLNRGENPNAFDAQGFPPLLHALGGYPGDVNSGRRYWHESGLRISRVPVMRSLLDHGARKDPKLPRDESVLGWAIKLEQKDVVDFLLHRGPKPGQKEGFNATPIIEAINNQDTALVKQLLDAGADPNLADNYYAVPLVHAVSAGTANLEIAILLIDRGAKINTTQYGRTPFMAAAHEGRDPKYAKLLLSRGAKINMISPGEKITALMLAAAYNSPEVVKTLLEAGADVNLRDKDGKTALDYAKKRDRKENIELLKRYGAKE